MVFRRALLMVIALLLPAALVAAEKGSIGISLTEFSPNGDGLHDTLDISGASPGSASVHILITDRKGRSVADLRPQVASDGKFSTAWEGMFRGKPLPNGTYNIALEGSQASARVDIMCIRKWPEVRYENEPFFPIGVWMEGSPRYAGYPATAEGANSYFERCCKDLADHGFNAIFITNTPEIAWEPLLGAAQKHGIKVALEIYPLGKFVYTGRCPESEIYETAKRVHAKIGRYDSLLRYYMTDEPGANALPYWTAVQRIMAAVDPKHPVASCICAGEVLAEFTDKTVLSEALWDCYPHLESMPEQQMGYFIPALFNAWVPSSKDRPMWGVLQAFAEPGIWRCPTREELRADTYLTLAAGGKGIIYFLYQYLVGKEVPEGALVNHDGTPRPFYKPVTRLVRELKTLSPLLITLKKAGFNATPKGDAHVGSFVDPKGQQVIIVASDHPEKSIVAELEGVPDGSWRDFLSGETFRSENGKMPVPLGAGEGRVLVGL